jgi:prepilin-type processing-associated H-X9-DG protein
MARRWNSEGLTRVEILVVILVGGFILSLLPAASRRAKSDANRVACGANLAVLGKAMRLYASDYQNEFPRAGGRNTTWGETVRWNASNRYQAYGLSADGTGGIATISSCFYLLVKYAEVRPRSFVCPGDTGTTEFRLSEGAGLPRGSELFDAWDFGPEAGKHCSYAYQMPFGLYALATSHDPAMPLAADRNPWLRSPASEARPIANFKPDLSLFMGTPEQGRAGNSISHRQDGQNVLFVDGHVTFAERSYCGLENDNIYLVSVDLIRGSPIGTVPVPPVVVPAHRKDSVLVHDPVYKVKTPPEMPNVDSKSLKQTSVVATLDCPLPEHKNAIWCSTFQMAWDKFREDVIREPIQVLGAQELASRLNGAPFPAASIEEKSYYAVAGFVKDGIVEQIHREMKRRFPLEPVPAFDNRYRTSDVILAYAYLNVDVAFEYPYYACPSAFDFQNSAGTRTGITAFRAQTSGQSSGYNRVREQTEILYYEDVHSSDTAEFAVDLSKRTQPYQVVLARVPRRSTLGEAARTLQEKIAGFKNDPNYALLCKLGSADTLIVPDVAYKLTHHFDELLGKSLGNPQWRTRYIFEAMQTIDFTLSRTGVVLKSEARLATKGKAFKPEKPRHLHFDRPFLICVQKRGPNATPFFLMWVDNAELMKPY